ncbi:MAG: polysaccharide deacetylase family protein [Kiloniellaceae bacterium]
MLGPGAAAPGAAAPPADNGAVVIMYHRFGESELPSTNIRLDQFEAHVDELTSGRYTVLPLPEIVRALAEDRPLPERTVGITIDDAFLSVYAEAWPRLRAAGLPFTVFVATGPLDRGLPGYMTWDQLRDMAAAGGVTVGHHGVTHGHMIRQSAAAARAEIAEAAQRFEQELGAAPTLFAYPYGEYSLAVRDMVARAGFEAAFGQHSGAIARTADRFALPRFPLNENYGDMDRFRLVVDSLPLPVTDLTPSDPLLEAGGNPPLYGFTVTDGIKGVAALNCFTSRNEITVERLAERRIEARLARPFPPGRARINCTMPGPDGRWRWLGIQFYVRP